MPLVTLQKEAKELIIETEDHGGYMSGYCFACGAHGWVDGVASCGYPQGSSQGLLSGLRHAANCPLGDILNDDGSFKK